MKFIGEVVVSLTGRSRLCVFAHWIATNGACLALCAQLAYPPKLNDMSNKEIV
jgi:hypothetical protein